MQNNLCFPEFSVLQHIRCCNAAQVVTGIAQHPPYGTNSTRYQSYLWRKSQWKYLFKYRNLAVRTNSKSHVGSVTFICWWIRVFRETVPNKRNLGAVLVYRYTGEFLLFSCPYMELWRSSLMFRSFVYRYTRTQLKFKSSCNKLTRYQLICPKQQKNNNNKSSNNIVFDFVEIHAKSERPS